MNCSPESPPPSSLRLDIAGITSFFNELLGGLFSKVLIKNRIFSIAPFPVGKLFLVVAVVDFVQVESSQSFDSVVVEPFFDHLQHGVDFGLVQFYG